MAKLSEVTLSGKSGTKFKFNVYPIGEECPNESGIYAFTKREPKGADFNHHVIYIGMAQSFQKRFYNHHKDDCIDKNGANCICLMAIKDEKQRTAIEDDLLKSYATKCNQVNNPITPR